MIIYKWVLMMVTLVIFLPLHGAAFHSTDSFINVPIAKQYRFNEIQFGLSHAYNGSASIQDTDQRYELDFKTVFAINHKNQVALNLVNPSQFVLHYQHTITPSFKPHQLAIGVRNITESSFSTWQNNEYIEDVHMSPYIVNTFYHQNSTFSIGYGLRQFMHTTKSLTGMGRFLENLNGVFLGFSYDFKMASLMAEYDGKDINFGFKIAPSDTLEINIGLTEQMISGDYNPQHQNAPRRQITIGISTRNLFSYRDHYNKQIRDLNFKIAEFEKKELEQLNQKNNELNESTKPSTESIIATLYSESLTDYNQRRYSDAIQKLLKASELDPQNAHILARLGSIYYTYGLLEHAAYYWKKAVETNPNLPEINHIQDFLNKYSNH